MKIGKWKRQAAVTKRSPMKRRSYLHCLDYLHNSCTHCCNTGGQKTTAHVMKATGRRNTANGEPTTLPQYNRSESQRTTQRYGCQRTTNGTFMDVDGIKFQGCYPFSSKRRHRHTTSPSSLGTELADLRCQHPENPVSLYYCH